MKCLHSYGNKVCGADLFASNNFCHKCGGQCCPKCTRSVTIPNARVCESCGWHLKGTLDQVNHGQYSTDPNNDRQSRSRTDQSYRSNLNLTRRSNNSQEWLMCTQQGDPLSASYQDIQKALQFGNFLANPLYSSVVASEGFNQSTPTLTVRVQHTESASAVNSNNRNYNHNEITSVENSQQHITSPQLKDANENFSHQSHEQSTSQNNGRTNTENSDVQKYEQLCFHAILGPNLLSDYKTDVVVIRIEGISEAKMNQKLSFKRQLEDEYAVYEGVVDVPRIGKSVLFYNYFVYLSGHNEVKEFVYNQGNNSLQSRRLNINNLVSKGIYHRYDGVVQGKPSDEDKDRGRIAKWVWKKKQKLASFFGSSDHQSMLKSEVEFSIETFLPDILESLVEGRLNGTDVLKHILDVVHGLSAYYFGIEKLWWNYGEYEKHVSQCMKQLLMKFFKNLIENSRTRKGKAVFHMAIVLIFCKDRYNIEWETSDNNLLFPSLLPNLDSNTKRCTDLEDLKESFPTMFDVVCKKILNQVKRMMNQVQNCNWFYCIPLLHFMEGRFEPYKIAPNVKHYDPVPKWWGTDSFEEDLKKFKSKEIPISYSLEVLKVIKPYFEVDYLLERTFVAALSRPQFKDFNFENFSPDVLLAAMYFCVKTTEECDGLVQEFQMMMAKLLTRLQSFSGGEYQKQKYEALKRVSIIAADFLRVCFIASIKCHVNWSTFWLGAAEIFLYSVHVLSTCQSSDERKDIDKDILNLVELNERKIADNLQGVVDFIGTSKWFTLWDVAFKLQIPEGSTKDRYIMFLQTSLQRSLSLKNSERELKELLDIYCIQPKNLHLKLNEILTKTAFVAIERCKDYLKLDSFDGKSDEKVRSIGILLSHMFMKNIQQEKVLSETETFLKFAVKLPSFAIFVKMKYTCQNALSEKCLEHLEKFVTVIKSICSEIVNGMVTVNNLMMVAGARDHFKTIILEVKDLLIDVDVVMTTLSLRKKQLTSFAEDQKIVKEFIYRTQNFGGDNKRLSQVLKRYENEETTKVANLCEDVEIKMSYEERKCTIYNPRTEKTMELHNYYPRVVAFELDINTMNSIKDLIFYCQGDSFTQLFEDRGTTLLKEKRKGLTTDEIVLEVWEPAKQYWMTQCERLKEGDITFSEFRTIFKTDDLKELSEELHRILDKSGNCEWIDLRIEQFQQYSSVTDSVKGASVIMKIKEVYGVTGDFTQIQDILDLNGSEDTPMKQMDHALLNTCKILNRVDSLKATSLKAFAECKKLVLWLRESMRSIKELQVFVDLASISAGEGDWNEGKVQSLHLATTGYGPLIFDFDQNCDAEYFLQRCEKVWQVLESSPKLPDKLRATNAVLEWLKSVKKSHGSVAVNSLDQAKAINATGRYEIGNNGICGRSKKLQLTDVLTLNFTVERDDDLEELPSEGATKVTREIKKTFRYQQLQELQSKLMLVAGKAEKGKEDVERFTLILSAVVGLGNAFIKLVSDGCVLFSNWHATFLCDQERPVSVFINFGHGNEAVTLKGRTDNIDNDVSSIILKLADFLEDCHKKWLNHISEKREKFHMLNYFTIDQIVFLQQELVKVGHWQPDNNPSVLVYPILSSVKQNCSQSDLIEALSQAQYDIVHLTRTEEEEEPGEPLLEEEMNEEQQTLLKQIMDNDYSEELARVALKHCGDDLEEVLVWCDEHEFDYNDIPVAQEPGQAEGELGTELSGWTKLDQSMSSLTVELIQQLSIESSEGNAFDKLHLALTELWERFLSSISSSVSDYLSIEHLGMILKQLRDQESIAVERSFSLPLKEGEPNLIVCHQNDVLNTVLSIYDSTTEGTLPKADEVLLCTSDTTVDMIEIFWRRSLFIDGERIYCLVNVDLLDYDVSDKAERVLESLMTDSRVKNNYRLVVVCSSENENKSLIVRALSKYQRQLFGVSAKKVQNFLCRNLLGNRGLLESACVVDFERSTVRVVKSWRAGVGKTLYKRRKAEELRKIYEEDENSVLTIPLHDKTVNIDEVMKILLDVTLPPGEEFPRIFHIDLSHKVEKGVDLLLFQLLILGCLTDSSGLVWRKSSTDYYIIESLPLLVKDVDGQRGNLRCLHNCLEILPMVMCRSPHESLEIMQSARTPQDYTLHDRLFDEIEFRSSTFQRPYQYLSRLDSGSRLDNVNPRTPEGNPVLCLMTLLRHCGIRDPSWSELYHFVSFLDAQLQDFEVSSFCSSVALQDLPGFPKFVLRFLIQMSRDFSTRSLQISEESPAQLFQVLGDDTEQTENDIIQQYQMKRTWESSPHPYLFFNPDHHSMTFLGFYIDKATGDMIDKQSKRILEKHIMDKTLFDSLIRNKVNLTEDFNALPRHEKILKLCNVMGNDMVHDPDDTYELTTDNVKKILAIYMRFRCDIPVIIMGETGCGKTRLVKFMCSLQQPPGVNVQNMILMKVHGGTKPSDIFEKVKAAEKKAVQNFEEYKHMDTVLFFDEANTTEAIGVIKEIMCDKSLGGKPMDLHNRLKIVAACNPYRKHPDDVIKKLEQSGLGYHVDAEKTTDKLGHIPMRNLVYRVQPLPQSLLPLVWDFGQLDTVVEEMYIRQMVLRYIRNGHFPSLLGLDRVLSKILTASQAFMREQKDEYSFVSLRDVERVLQVMSWFYNHSVEKDNLLFSKIKSRKLKKKKKQQFILEDDDNEEVDIDDITRSLVLALGVCYHACLVHKRKQYRNEVALHFRSPLTLPGGAEQFLEEISKCQSVLVDNIDFPVNIAKNKALKENVFMMIICIELRIPMFLVGKPGSSKSLAKTMVADAMQGNNSMKELFRSFKQAQMVSYQCSPLSTPEGIVGTFKQCAAYQNGKDLEKSVSIVVLDEIGLAEDSPRMPLKTLHPLLEDGCCDNEKPEPHKKVAFIGISNWALDPAKMNRGILVQREVPDKDELLSSARKICSADSDVQKKIKPLIEPLALSYKELFEKASQVMREFFGLRDFYSLMKMLYAFVSKSRKAPTWLQLQHCILRNFGGLPADVIKPVEIFSKHITCVDKKAEKTEFDPECTPTGMINESLKGTNFAEGESRYLLLLTENYGALTILQQKIFSMHNAEVIFGSSFPSDQEYTQVCRNINRIKVCMETGNTVILLNLENLYESLYDALNQYYVEFGGDRYVDLGLGTHRVKCRVDRQFRLIVVAEKQVVYDKFPIPLINRLEKHFLSMNTMLTMEQAKLTEELLTWVKTFAEHKLQRKQFEQRTEKKIGEAFIGYHPDSCAAVIQHICEKNGLDDYELEYHSKKILREAKEMLLWCAAPHIVAQNKDLEEFEIYNSQQQHESLAEYLKTRQETFPDENIYAQITTKSRIMTPVEVLELCKCLTIDRQNVTSLSLQQFHTEQQFSRKIKSFADRCSKAETDSLLMVQCSCIGHNTDVIACSRYILQRELQLHQAKSFGVKSHVVILVQLPAISASSFTGFQCGLWHSAHIDDIHMSSILPPLRNLQGKTCSEILSQKPKVGLEESFSTMCIDDIDTGDIAAGITQSEQPTEQNFDMEKFIVNCIHPALACLKDLSSDSGRTTQRLKIVLDLLENKTDNPISVLSGIVLHTTEMIKEKESFYELAPYTDCLMQLASRPENINKSGTFRKSISQHLISKVKPIIASIIAFIDTNRNLDILRDDNIQQWKLDMWLHIINNPQLTQLKYSSIVSPNQHQEIHEVIIRTTSASGRVFSGMLPFSWLIFDQIESILHSIRESMENKENLLELVLKAGDIFHAWPFGKLLSGYGESFLHIFKAYIRDMVYMSHPVQSEEESNLICESIVNGCRTLLREVFGNILQSIISSHIVYVFYATRFKNFSQIVSVWPDCSKRIVEVQEKESNNNLVTDEEMTLDVLALQLLIEELKPAKDALNKVETRNKWLQLVCLYRQPIERIFGHFKQNADNHEYLNELRCEAGLVDARYKWTKTMIVKLFIEHICMADDSDSSEVIRCMALWTKLGDKADLKTLPTFEKIEAHLKGRNEKILNQCFGLLSKCENCERDIRSQPFKLPCQHVFCMQCYKEFIVENHQCSSCQSTLPENFNPEDLQKREHVTKYQEFRRRCNRFFMDVISQLCFADGTSPSPQVIQKLQSYVVGLDKSERGERFISRQLTVFQDSIDPNPVVRSVLLQLLMQTSGTDVMEHLSTYFEHGMQLVRGDNSDSRQMIELCLLILQCKEDSLNQQYQQYDDISVISRMLREACPNICMLNVGILERIENIAKTKFALTKVANYIHKFCGNNGGVLKASEVQLFETAGQVCDDCRSPWPRQYFVKQVCRTYGLETYQRLTEKSDAMDFLKWTKLPDFENKEVQECHDRYIVCGQFYKDIREAVVKAALKEDDTDIREILQDQDRDMWKFRVKLLLALHREVTMSQIFSEEKKFTDQGFTFLLEFLMRQDLFRNKEELISQVMKNKIWQNCRVNVYTGMNLTQQNITCLLTHYWVLMMELPGQRTLLTPLENLALHPELMLNSYFPTMPHDEMVYVKDALTKKDETVMFYTCPDGHLYVIGDCGRPYLVGKCNICGKDIGGTSHKATQGNFKVESNDTTATGHCLGRASNLSQQSGYGHDRSLDRASITILRLLTHMSMVVAANIKPEIIISAIKLTEDMTVTDVPDFLLDHIFLGIESLQKILGKSKDDVFVLIHFILARIMEKHSMNIIGETVPVEMCELSNKNARLQWEQQFAKRYIHPVLKKLDKQLKVCNEEILNDKRLGQDPLMQLIYETNDETDQTDIGDLQNIPVVWRYRSHISVDHLTQMLNTSQQNCSVLEVFLEEEPVLRAIKFIPSIIRLQRILIQKYNRKVDKTEAVDLTVGRVEELIVQERNSEEFLSLFEDFTEAWELARNSLESYTCFVGGNTFVLKKQYCRQRISDRTPLSFLLPTLREEGLCSYMLLRFLLERQNTFLGKYCQVTGRSLNEMSKVGLYDLSAAHLISYHPDKDLLPIVLANCNYSFEVGQGTKVEYDFRNIERQVIDRFLFSKSVITEIEKIILFKYRTEFSAALAFDDLCQRVKQERIEPRIYEQITNDLEKTEFTEICESVLKLDVAISFLKSVGVDSNYSLYDFMTKTLKIDHPFPNCRKAQQGITCGNTMSWWVTLTMEIEKQQLNNNQNCFDDIPDRFKVPLKHEQGILLAELTNSLSLDHIGILMVILFECIVFKLDVQNNYILNSEVSLKDVLIPYIDASPYENDTMMDGHLRDAILSLPGEDNDANIRTEQIIDVWKTMNKSYITKQLRR